MVNDLFKFCVIQEHGEYVADILSLYGNLFERLGIHIDDYEDECNWTDWDDEDNLQAIFKKILLKEAQDNGIIPDFIDIDEQFNIDGDFAIYKSSKDDNQLIQDIVTDFKDWTGIELNIIS